MPPAPDQRPKAPVASTLGLVSRCYAYDNPLRRIRFCVLAQSDLFQLRNEYVSELRQVEHRARDLTNRAFTAPTERLVRPEAFTQDLLASVVESASVIDREAKK